MINTIFRKAQKEELPAIWMILKQAIQRRKDDGSSQWQDGYPNPEIIGNDIEKGVGFVLTNNNLIIGYTAVLINDEPEYDKLEGTWLTQGDFVVFHRVAISKDYLGKGYAKKILEGIENYAIQNDIYSVKADTNFDNNPMLALFEKSGYSYCGTVYFRNSPRRAFEKILNKPS